MEQTQHTLENTVVPMTMKNIAMIIACTVSIIGSIIGSYYFLSKQIHDTNNKVDVFNERYTGDGKYNDLRFRTLEAGLNLVEIKINEMQTRNK